MHFVPKNEINIETLSIYSENIVTNFQTSMSTCNDIL